MATRTERERIEGTDPALSVRQLLSVRVRTRRALWKIADRISPGMTEEEGRATASQVLRASSLRRGWHKVLVRFGSNTTKNFHDPSEPGVVLGENDIFFIDIGPVFDGCEGDAGETVAVGGDPEMVRAAADVKVLWQRVRDRWLADGLTGEDLYLYATEAARDMGWVLNLELTGHRLSEFPHDAHYDGTLAHVGFRPQGSLWVLEIQIRHPKREFGAFFEDLLLEDDALQGFSMSRSSPGVRPCAG
jgi:methionyl aminopeptidase